MVFSSTLFLGIFLPLVVVIYFCSPNSWRNTVLTAFSIVFYAWGAPAMVPMLVMGMGLDFFIARGIASACGNKRRQLSLITASVTVNLSLLLYYKYANFFVEQINTTLNLLGQPEVFWTQVALPIGISFFTFHKLSYVIDVYRGIVPPARTFREFSLYVLLFPQLVAGPIIRYHDIAGQIRERTHSLDNCVLGAMRFMIGLGKKVLIADELAHTADVIFALPSDQLTPQYAWLGATCYAFQIFFDFSGYSDMAIGLGRIFGFHFLENFNHPYISQTVTEFWKRWHISLTNWMREYLYVSLGGNRLGNVRTYINLWTVFLISGLWHGASWTFLCWGIYHGGFLVFDRICWSKFSKHLPPLINVALTFVAVLFGWVLFRSSSVSQFFSFSSCMLFATTTGVPSLPSASIIGVRGIFILVVAVLLSFIPAILKEPSLGFSARFTWGRFLACLAIYVLALMSLLNSSFHPFIYFRF